MTKDAKDAMKLINEKLKTMTIDDDYIEGHRIDQRKDFKKINTKIVFNERCTNKLLSFIDLVLNTDYREYGTYFYGNLCGNLIYIDDFYSDFQLADGLFKNGAVDVTKQNLEELDNKTEKSKTKNPCDVVMHFHTHPDHVIDESGSVIDPASQLMSEQDLYSYGYHQKYLQPVSNNPVVFIGGMISKNNNNPEFSIVFYDDIRKCFFNIGDNIYLTHNSELSKLDNKGLNNYFGVPQEISDKIKTRILELKNKENN